MKRRSLYFTSILGLLVATTLAFQNCNNKKFATTASSHVKGLLNSMDTDGQISGHVESPLCDEQEEIDKGTCPESGVVKFYAIETNHSKTFIGTTEATLEKQPDGKYQYVFSFTVPSEHVCKKIEAYAVDPETQEEVLIQPDDSFIMWGDTKKCETFGDEDDDDDDNDTGAVNIDGIHQDGRLVEVYGTCTSGSAVTASGDLNALINKSDVCTGGHFKHCDFLAKDAADNQIVETQGASSDSIHADGANPSLVLTFDQITKTGGLGLAVNGKCTPGGHVKLTIYNEEKADIVCSAGGTYSYSGSPLKSNVQTRILYGRLTTLFGNKDIQSDIDSVGTPVCAISEVKPRTDYCTNQAATIKGSCSPGLPILVYMNGDYQNIGYCVGGAFEIPNVLLKKVGVNNVVKIEQKSPTTGATCSESRTITSF